MELPPEYRLPDNEVQRIREEQRQIEERRAVAKEKEQKDREEQRKRSRDGGAFFQSGYFGWIFLSEIWLG